MGKAFLKYGSGFLSFALGFGLVLAAVLLKPGEISIRSPGVLLCTAQFTAKNEGPSVQINSDDVYYKEGAFHVLDHWGHYQTVRPGANDSCVTVPKEMYKKND